MKFIDEATIQVHAGKGGDGSAAFRREKFVPRGGPSGGDGGRGGSVWAVADRNINTLVDYRFARIHRAEDGDIGRGADKYGRGGEDIVAAHAGGHADPRRRRAATLVADLAQDGQRALLAKGGQGGLGNLHFKSSINRAPRQFTRGEPGESRELALELRVLADVGLLGLPNAGKSTFIRAVSSARPKVADYPFTTLNPSLGVVRIAHQASFVVADIPGLIEGAAEGAGLGPPVPAPSVAHPPAAAPRWTSRRPTEDADPARRRARRSPTSSRNTTRRCTSKPRWLVFNKADLAPEDADARVRAHRARAALEAALVHDLGDQRQGLQAAVGADLRIHLQGSRSPRAAVQPSVHRRRHHAGRSRSAPRWSPTRAAAWTLQAIARWAAQVAQLRARGKRCVMVSSGAIAEGMQRLGWSEAPARDARAAGRGRGRADGPRAVLRDRASASTACAPRRCC